MSHEGTEAIHSSPPQERRSKSRSPKQRRKDVEVVDPDIPPRPTRGTGSGSLPDMRRSQKSPLRLSTNEADRRGGSEFEPKERGRSTLGASSSSQARDAGKLDASSGMSSEEEMLTILDSPRDMAFFRGYLVSEFIDELLDFYLAVDEWREHWLRFKDKPRSSKIRKTRQEAVEIYVTFLKNDAPRLINIPGGERVVIGEIFAPLMEVLDPLQASPPQAGTTFNFASPTTQARPPLKLPKSCPELDQLDITDNLFDNVQATTFNMLLEPFVRFLEDPAFRSMQTDRLKRPIKEALVTRRVRLKAHRPVKFEDVIDDADIFTSFEGVLAKEYSEDYLGFYAQLQHFFSASRPSEWFDLANRIYQTYVADEKVHISPGQADAILANLQSKTVDRHCFDFVRYEVEAILKTKFADNLGTISNEVSKARRQRLS